MAVNRAVSSHMLPGASLGKRHRKDPAFGDRRNTGRASKTSGDLNGDAERRQSRLHPATGPRISLPHHDTVEAGVQGTAAEFRPAVHADSPNHRRVGVDLNDG